MFGTAISQLRKGASEPLDANEVSWFLRFAFLYLVVASLIVGSIVGFSAVASPAVGGGSKFFYFIKDVLLGMFSVFIGLFLVIGWQRIKLRGGALLKVFVACVLMQSGFTMMKSAFPMLMPFYADPFLANLDLAIHGVDPWEWAHGLIGMGEGQKLFLAYTRIWTVCALLFPVILVLVDSDKARVKRFLILFLVAWVFLGNVVAFSGLSVGPIFYDRLLGGARFAGLTAVLADGGMQHTVIGMIQDTLWQLYSSGANSIGTGISAFPSVHVAVASVAAFYLAERSRWLALPGFGYLALVMFLSVYTGFHYAVDGYASVAVIGAAWAALKWRAAARANADAQEHMAAPAAGLAPAE